MMANCTSSGLTHPALRAQGQRRSTTIKTLEEQVREIADREEIKEFDRLGMPIGWR